MSAFEITKAAERLRDECNRWIERCGHHSKRCSSSVDVNGGRTARMLAQRQHHLKLIERHIRMMLDRAYPNGLPAGRSASWRLNDGDELVAALERIAAGTYGICAECGREISLTDLWARPQDDQCRHCRLDHPQPPERTRYYVI
jgi:hypothetical protein